MIHRMWVEVPIEIIPKIYVIRFWMVQLIPRISPFLFPPQQTCLLRRE